NGQNEHRNSGAREKTAQKQSFEAVLVRNLMSVQNQIAFEAVVPRFPCPNLRHRDRWIGWHSLRQWPKWKCR
ncbi:MAG: hypothetical protein Q8M20_14930, partial [Rhodocyclaceae bacterium]|nr:hypothetical protein [Rhodocyclaceae bacterium]MDZ4216294.1 hypothetical protein [Rhodocyclaceae bacterium]